MKQLSDEWFKARVGKLTGSAVGAALGVNPWKCPEDVIRDMVRDYHGLDRDFKSNIATEYGQEHEPLAVMDYLGETGDMVEECGFFVHPEYEWLGASPDGLIGENGLIEIKCPFSQRNKKEPVFKTAKEQPHYYAQMQIEMACTGRRWCDFYQWSKHGTSLEHIPFDGEWFSNNLPALEAFYKWFLTEIDNPEHLEDKFKEINTITSKHLIDEYDQLSATIEDANARKKEVMAELVQLSKERNAVIHGRKLTKVERKGSVDYKKVPELNGVDLEQYRKKPSEFWKLS